MYGIMLIAVLVITGGAVAFIGDRLGTKIGKKRLSVLGLRPRHTSVLITILTGIFITTLTFGVMAAVSEDVRTALFGMEQLNQSMQEARADLEKAAMELAAAKKEQEQTNEALAKSKAEMGKLQAESERLKEGNLQLEQKNAELAASNDDLAARNDDLATKNDSLERENASLLEGNASLHEANDKLLADNKLLESQTEDLSKGILSMREGDIVFRANEVIASGVIRAGGTKEDVMADFGAVMNIANRNVSQRVGENAQNKEIWLFQPEYDAAIEKILASKQDMIVRILAAGNLLFGEPVCTTLQLYPNSIIYQKDEFIISRSYQLPGGTANSHFVENVLMEFLKDINQQATARGILPDPITGAVGAMEGDQFYGIVNDLSMLKGPVTISAYARSVTDALGPLRLKLKVNQMSSAGE